MMGFNSSIKSLQVPTNTNISSGTNPKCVWLDIQLHVLDVWSFVCYLKARGLVLPSPSTRDSVMSMLSERIMGTTCLNSEERDGEPTICISKTSSTHMHKRHSSADRAFRLFQKIEVPNLSEPEIWDPNLLGFNNDFHTFS